MAVTNAVLAEKIDGLGGKIECVNTKLDKFIDVQSKCNDAMNTRAGELEIEQGRQDERISNLRNVFTGVQGLMTLAGAGVVAWLRGESGGG